MQSLTFEAALSWDERATTFLPSAEGRVQRRVGAGDRSESFGLLEPDASGWLLFIPHGARVEATIDEAPIDLDRLVLDASGERRLRVCPGLKAKVDMGEFRFEVRPAA
jgi:hypothetical protein